MFEADQSLGAYRWKIVHLRSGSQTEVVLLSSRFFCLTTHWVGHTILCPGEDCPLCELIPARGLFYLATLWNSRVSILELGATSASYFEQGAKFSGGGMLPGNVFALSRVGAKSPVRSEFVRRVDNVQNVTHIELATRVMALYKFPPPNPTEDLKAYEARMRLVAKSRAVRHAELASKKAERASKF